MDDLHYNLDKEMFYRAKQSIGSARLSLDSDTVLVILKGAIRKCQEMRETVCQGRHRESKLKRV